MSNTKSTSATPFVEKYKSQFLELCKPGDERLLLLLIETAILDAQMWQSTEDFKKNMHAVDKIFNNQPQA